MFSGNDSRGETGVDLMSGRRRDGRSVLMMCRTCPNTVGKCRAADPKNFNTKNEEAIFEAHFFFLILQSLPKHVVGIGKHSIRTKTLLFHKKSTF